MYYLLINFLDFCIENDLIKIDQLAKQFAKSFYNNLLKNEEKNILFSEHSTYMLVFSLLVTDLDIKKDKFSNEEMKNKDRKFYDLMVILKNLNEGENFECSYLKDNYKFSKLIGFCNFKIKNNTNFTLQKVGLHKNGKFKQYYYHYLEEGIIILFINKKLEVIEKVIYLKNDTFYNYKEEKKNLTITILSHHSKKNLLLFKNKLTYIKYKKYSNLMFKFDNLEHFTQILNNLKAVK